MLKNILAISGKPGLYKLISQGNKSLIVETLDAQKKRIPAFGAEKIVSLNDIAIYTDDDAEISLGEVFESIKEKYNCKVVELSPKKASNGDIINFFESILPNYDPDRVHISDMRKVLSWYNILSENGITEFRKKNESETSEK